MSARLPDFIDPWRAASTALSLTGELPACELPRLVEFGFVGAGDDRALGYRLDFRRDEGGQAYLEGWLRLRLGLVCQRCLADLWLDLEAPLGFILARSESAVMDNQDQGEILIVQESLDLRALIEDEILLAIPSFPRHAAGECQPPPQTRYAPALAPSPPEHPFAVLARLKKR